MGGGARSDDARARRRAGEAVASAVALWFERNARSLPWRTTPRDPYRSLVSEFMLQQTQVSRVLEKFGPFMARFPTLRDLAAAPESEVLALWSGLGYYRRARLLHGAARAIVSGHGGVVPSEVAALSALPGVGRYTAGAIASIVFDRAEPIVDGNVARVLFRVHGRAGAAGPGAGERWAWERAAEMARAGTAPAKVNEGLMELGATVCVARGPRCAACPLAELCVARRRGLQGVIPGAKRAARRRAVAAECVVVRDRRGRLLVERRPARGMWASMWQAPTLERDAMPLPAGRARAALEGWLRVGGLSPGERFVHGTSHREVHVRVWHAPVLSAARALGLSRRCPGLAWKTEGQAARLALSNPQRRILLGP